MQATNYDVPPENAQTTTCETEGQIRDAIAGCDEQIQAFRDTDQELDDESALLFAELQAARAQLQESLEQLQAAVEAEPVHHDAAHQPINNDQGVVAIGPHLPPGKKASLRCGNNARIHPRNRYAFMQPDFPALARQHPSLQPYLLQLPAPDQRAHRGKKRPFADGDEPVDCAIDDADMAGVQPMEERRPKAAGQHSRFDFTNAHAARELTKVLLRVDFGLDWWIPDGQLIPPLVNRANYIHWIEDLLQLSSPPAGVSSAGQAHAEKDKQNEEKHKENKQEQKEQGTVLGLDIGCGTNLIYPLLGCAINPHWRFVAVDITPVALQWARRNADANEGVLQGRVVVRESGQPPALGAARALHPGERFAFTMCNPPFFESIEQAGGNPRTNFAGTAEEMVWPGGDLGFVQQMVQESASLPRGTVHWFTSLIGRKDSLKKLRMQLYSMQVTALRTTEFSQGRTSRWGIAWSWTVPAALANKPLERHT